jgi:hypothetical protein
MTDDSPAGYFAPLRQALIDKNNRHVNRVRERLPGAQAEALSICRRPCSSPCGGGASLEGPLCAGVDCGRSGCSGEHVDDEAPLQRPSHCLASPSGGRRGFSEASSVYGSCLLRRLADASVLSIVFDSCNQQGTMTRERLIRLAYIWGYSALGIGYGLCAVFFTLERYHLMPMGSVLDWLDRAALRPGVGLILFSWGAIGAAFTAGLIS